MKVWVLIYSFIDLDFVLFNDAGCSSGHAVSTDMMSGENELVRMNKKAVVV